jgi:uncharacterized protein (TIGR02466 family)
MTDAPATPGTTALFTTLVHRATLGGRDDLIADLSAIAWSLADDDEAGQQWCEDNGYPGYTSYGTLDDMPVRYSVVEELIGLLDAHVARFAGELAFDLGGKALVLDHIWVNILPEGGIHTGHIHPHSVISGTLYVEVPDGASALKIEDPRLAMMMAAPTRTRDAPLNLQPFVFFAPVAGELLLWESWLRHEVVMNRADEDRVSVSFNYRWE